MQLNNIQIRNVFTLKYPKFCCPVTLGSLIQRITRDVIKGIVKSTLPNLLVDIIMSATPKSAFLVYRCCIIPVQLFVLSFQLPYSFSFLTNCILKFNERESSITTLPKRPVNFPLSSCINGDPCKK